MHSLFLHCSHSPGWRKTTWSLYPGGACTFPPISRASWCETRSRPSYGMGGQPVRSMELDREERSALRDLHLLTIKPTLYVANVSEDGFEANPALDAVRRLAEAEGSEVVPVCAAIEAEIVQLAEEERQEFLAEMGLDEPGLNRVVRAGYRLLGLETYFTAGEKEVRAWTIPVGATAPQAAGVIHTDFERGFIRAEVIAYDDFVRYRGEQGAKEAGKLRLEGKEYVVRDGDVIHFRFNV